jgi:hypothetical protein
MTEPVNAIDQIRTDVERLGGSVGVIAPNARWVQLDGVFTPEQLKRLAKEVERKWKDRS